MATKINMKYALSIFLCFLLGTSNVHGQEELPAGEAEVVKDFEIKTKKGTRIKTTPEAYKVDPPNYNYQYDIEVNPVAVEYPAPYILPVAMQPDDPKDYYNGFIKASYGSLNNPSLSAQYDLIATDYYTLGAKVDFSRFDEKDTPNKSYGQTYVDLHADYFLTQEQKISIKLGTNIQDVHAYGFNHLADSILTDIGMANDNLTDVFFDASYSYANEESKLGYSARLAFNRISAGLSNQSESNVVVEMQGTTQFNSSILLGLNVGINYAKLSNAVEGSDDVVYANPFLNFSKGKAGIRLGATFANGSEGATVFPDAQIRLNLSRQAFILELGAEGEYVQQGLKHLSGINPFLAKLDFIEDSKQYNFYVGLSGHLKKEVSYSVRAGYKLLDNLNLFINSYNTDRRLFTILQDDISSKYLAANITLHPSDQFSLDVGFTKQILDPYFDGVQDVARASFHMVPLLVESNLNFVLVPDRINLNAGLYFMEGVKYLKDTGGVDKTDFGLDVNFGLDAKVIDRVSFFAEAKNLLSSNYERFYGYENFGVNFLGGVKVKL